jgi:hypothetical protein
MKPPKNQGPLPPRNKPPRKPPQQKPPKPPKPLKMPGKADVMKAKRAYKVGGLPKVAKAFKTTVPKVRAYVKARYPKFKFK